MESTICQSPDRQSICNLRSQHLKSLQTLVVFFLSFTALAAEAQTDPSLDVVLDRLDSYLRAYEKQLSAITADERYVQHEQRVGWTRGDRFSKIQPPLVRRLDSEMAFVRLPGDGDWAGFRDVRRVDGKSVTESRVRLGELFARGSNTFEQATAITAASSKYNLGATRTVNMPTVPLEVLHPRHRHQFSYRLVSKERVRRARTMRVEFVEVASPTVIQLPAGGDVPSAGTAWIEPTTGRLWRAMVVWKGGQAHLEPRANDSRVTVDFDLDRRLETMVPIEMKEVFYVPDGRGEGRATYRNFKRFETGARIVPQ